MAHSYPADLADFVVQHWNESAVLAQEYCEAADEPLPDAPVLRSILSICYQAKSIAHHINHELSS